MREYSAEYVRANMVAVAALVTAGVKMGEPEARKNSGCDNCLFHGYDAEGNDLDGGSATMLLSYHTDGTYTLAEIRPVLH